MTKMAENYPNETYFDPNSSEIANKLTELKEILEELLQTDISTYSPKCHIFYEKTLPLILKNLLLAPKSPKNLVQALETFLPTVMQFIFHTDIPAKLINPLLFCFNQEISNPKQIKYPIVPDNDFSDFIHNKVPSQSVFEKTSISHANNILKTLIKSIINSKFFGEIQNRINKRILTNAQLDNAIKIFRGLYPYLSKKFDNVISTILINETIINVKQSLTDTHYFLQFISAFAPMSPQSLDNIYSFFATIMTYPQLQSRAVKEFKMVILQNGIGNSAVHIKNAILSLIMEGSSSTMKIILDLVPESISPQAEFTDDDMIQLLKSPNSPERKIILRKIISSSKQPFDRFSEAVIESDNFFDPELICALIGQVSDDKIANNLFLKLTDPVRCVENYDLSGIRMNDRLENMMNTDNLETLISFMNFVANTPQLGLFPNYIMKIIDIIPSHPEVLDVLEQITRFIPSVSDATALASLFEKYLESYNSGQFEHSSKLASILHSWIDVFPKDLPFDPIFSVLMDNDFLLFADKLPFLIETLIKRCPKQQLISNLLKKLLDISVPSRYANWFVSNLFDYLHDDKKVGKITKTLTEQLNDPSKAINALFVIIEAVMYEADFYQMNPKSSFGYTQTFIVSHKGKEKTIKCTFHPYQTTTSIYSAVSSALSIYLGTYALKICEDSIEKLIPLQSPLINIPLSPSREIHILVIDIDDEPIPTYFIEYQKHFKEIQPLFINSFAERASILFDYLDSPNYGELVFELLLLFGPFEKIQSTSPVQDLLFHKCENPFVFASNRRIFPTAVKIALNNFKKSRKKYEDYFDLSIYEFPSNLNEMAEFIVKIMINSHNGQGSLANLCSSLFNWSGKIVFAKETLKQGLIESRSRLLRETISALVSVEETDPNVIFELIQTAMLRKNRTRTKQFFELVKQFNLNPESLIPFYQELDQFEVSFYKDSDETFIGLIQLIPANDTTVNLTLDRLFSPPTCRTLHKPYIHTIESWKAAYNFLSTPLAAKKLNMMLHHLHIPSSTNETLSSDFTYKGRNGIYNLGTTCYANALLQVFNTIDPLALSLISYETAKLAPLEIELRAILAQLRFVRGTILSTTKLVETIPEFVENVQQDANEFLVESLINPINTQLKDGSITECLRGKRLHSICAYDGRVLHEREEDFYILEIPADHISKLSDGFERFFADDPMDDGYIIEETKEKVPAYHHKSIVKWPDFLSLQLQRWEFTQNMGGTKLVHRYGFPIVLDPNDLNCSIGTAHCDFQYSLCGIVVHQGTAEQGHYYAVVEGDDKEWYLCDDSKIIYFDLKEIPDFAFGMSETTSLDEDVSTGYLLFYRRMDLQPVQPNLPADLEEHLNIKNVQLWPSIIFRSPDFLKYVYNFLAENDKLIDKDTLSIAYQAFFKIAPCDSNLFTEWCELFIVNLFNAKNCYDYALNFFEFISKEVGSELLYLFTMNETLVDPLKRVLFEAFEIVNDSLEPLRILIKSLDNLAMVKQSWGFMLDAINAVCTSFNIDWKENIDDLYSMFVYICFPFDKELYRNISNQHQLAFNSLIDAVLKSIESDSKSKQVTLNKAVYECFNAIYLNRVILSVKKSANFEQLMTIVKKIKPDIIINALDASQPTRQFLATHFDFRIQSTLFVPIEEEKKRENNEKMTLSIYESLLFSASSKIRIAFAQQLNALTPIDKKLEFYLNQTLIKLERKEKPSKIINSDFFLMDNIVTKLRDKYPYPHVNNEKSRLGVILLSLFDSYLSLLRDGYENRTLEYLNLLLLSSRIDPLIFAFKYELIFEVFNLVQLEKSIQTMIEILRNTIVAFPIILQTIVNVDDNNFLSQILQTSVYSKAAVDLLFIFTQYANESPLLSCCVKHFMENPIDEYGALVFDLISAPVSIKPLRFEIIGHPKQESQILIANCLFNCWRNSEDDVSDLVAFIKEIIDMPRPFIPNSIKIAMENIA